MQALVKALQSHAEEISRADLFMDDTAAGAIALLHGREKLQALNPIAVLPLQPPSLSSWERLGGWWPDSYWTPGDASSANAQRAVVLIGAQLDDQVNLINNMVLVRSGRVRRCLVLAALESEAPLPAQQPGIVWRKGPPPGGRRSSRPSAPRRLDGTSGHCTVELQHLPQLAAATVWCHDYHREQIATYEQAAWTATPDQPVDEDLQRCLAKSCDPAAGVVLSASQEDVQMAKAIQASMVTADFGDSSNLSVAVALTDNTAEALASQDDIDLKTAIQNSLGDDSRLSAAAVPAHAAPTLVLGNTLGGMPREWDHVLLNRAWGSDEETIADVG
jgi:hypothetical protein